MKTMMISAALAFLLVLPPAIAVAEDAAPSADQPAAPPAPPAPGDDAGQDVARKAKVFSMQIGGDEESGGKAHGITITMDDDEERMEIKADVVDRVVGDLESALAGLPAEVRAELDADDIDDLRRALEDVRRLKQGPGRHDDEADNAYVQDIIPGVVAIVLLFGGPIVIVAIVSYNNRRKRQMVHETIDRIIAQGKDVPVELLDALDKGQSGQNGRSRLARGTVSVGLGLGLGGMLYAVGGAEVASIGLIPLCIGLAHLLVWKLEKPAENRPATG